MHANNMKWLQDLKREYPLMFSGKKVLELGAEGSWPEVRELFQAEVYIGVDILAGPNVDIVRDARDTDFWPEYFDVILCLSMFEHDPYWQESLAHNLQWLKNGGLVIGCHGAEGNLHHGPDPWAVVPHQEFLDFCGMLPVKVITEFFEEEKYGPDVVGAYDWLLEKNDVSRWAPTARGAVAKMEKDNTVYVVTYQGPKIKRTVTGKFSGTEEDKLILEDKNGRFNNVPIDAITRINYYGEGRAPF